MAFSSDKGLFVTEAQLAKRLHLPIKGDRGLFQFLQDKKGFPKPEPDFGNKRYFPAVIQWLDHEFGLDDLRPYFRENATETWHHRSKKKRKTRWGE